MRFVCPLVLVLLSACATARVERPDTDWAAWPGEPPALIPSLVTAATPRESASAQLAARATSLVGVSLARATPWLPDDCTGLARAVYEPAGVDLMYEARPGDNGVTAMHRTAKRVGALHQRTPAPGDLVFFRETYDRNRDGRRNDGLTHVGVVESVSPDGEVTFVHRGGKGVSRSRLNLRAPLSKEKNDVLRTATRSSRARLTGELFVGYASSTKLLRPAR